MNDLSRREFLKRSALGLAALSAGSLGLAPQEQKPLEPGALRKRVLIVGAGLALLVALTGGKRDSALDFFRDDLGHRGAKSLGKIHGGNDLLPRAFAERLKEKIRFGSGVARRQARSQTFAADYLIVTIPFSVLRRLEVTPPSVRGRLRGGRT